VDFVIGHPRSGTMFVSHLLNACRPEVSAHELLFALSWESVSLASEYYAGRADRAAVERVLELYAQRPSGPTIDSNWKLTWMLPVLLERFGSARVLHLVREPRVTIQSCLDLDYYGTSWALPPADESERRRNYWLRWMPEIRRDDWSVLGQFERNCAFWSETQRLAAAAETLGSRYLRVRLEDLDDDRAVRRVAELFELPAPGGDALAALRSGGRLNVKEHEKRAVREQRDRSPAWDELAFERLCGATARSLGY
jgi:hypothetical protein